MMAGIWAETCRSVQISIKTILEVVFFGTYNWHDLMKRNGMATYK
jgi:hypothetical protein